MAREIQAEADATPEAAATDGGRQTPHGDLDEASLPDGWTISTALDHHTGLYHQPTGRSLAAIKHATRGDWAVRGLANYGGDALFGRGVDPQRAAHLLEREAALGSAGDWTDNPDPVGDAPPSDDAATQPAADTPDDEPDQPDESVDTTGQSTLGDW